MYDYSPQWVVKDKLAKSGRPGRELGAAQGVPYYRQNGFAVVHLPVRDPAHHPKGREILEEILEKAWQAFQDLPGPVLVHCSAGIDRTGRVIGYIRSRLDEERAGGRSDVR